MIRATALAIALTTVTVGAEPATLSPAQMRVVASESVVKGLPEQGVRLAEALLQRDPEDVDALLILSRGQRNLGRFDEALDAARAAWRLAEGKPHRFAAAMARAQALSSKGYRTRAQLWLRRAAEAAPNDRSKAVAVRDFRYVRSRNKWATQLDFNISPSDNINNGSTSETTELFGLPLEFALNGTSRALPGTEFATGVATRYRLRQTDLSHVDATFRLTHRTYTLSSEARDRAPDAKGRDFALTQASAGLATRGAFSQTSKFGYAASFELGRAWYGGDPYLNFARAEGGLTYVISPKAQVRATLGHEWQEGLDARADADITRARLSLSHRLDNGPRFDWTIGYERSVSEADYLDFTRRDAGVRMTLAKPVFGANLAFGVSASEKHHDFSGLTAGARTETTYSADMVVTLPQIEVMGFVPSVRVSTSRTDGPIDLLDSSETGIGFGIRSSF